MVQLTTEPSTGMINPPSTLPETKLCTWKWIGWLVQIDSSNQFLATKNTPPKTAPWNLKMDPLEKEIPIGKLAFSGSMLNFGGCTPLKTNSKRPLKTGHLPTRV